jgi:hypothetical protein
VHKNAGGSHTVGLSISRLMRRPLVLHDEDWFTTPVSQIVTPGSHVAERPSQSLSAHGRVRGGNTVAYPFIDTPCEISESATQAA